MIPKEIPDCFEAWCCFILYMTGTSHSKRFYNSGFLLNIYIYIYKKDHFPLELTTAADCHNPFFFSLEIREAGNFFLCRRNFRLLRHNVFKNVAYQLSKESHDFTSFTQLYCDMYLFPWWKWVFLLEERISRNLPISCSSHTMWATMTARWKSQQKESRKCEI